MKRKSGLKMRLERFKIQKFSYPGKEETPFPGPYPPQPLPFGPRRVFTPLSLGPLGSAHFSPPWQKASCALVMHTNKIK